MSARCASRSAAGLSRSSPMPCRTSSSTAPSCRASAPATMPAASRRVKGIELVLTGDAAELAERVKGRHDADDPKIDWLVVIFWTLIILWFIWVTWRSTQRSAYRRGSGPIFIPGPGWGGGSGGGGWSGGNGGGGFSGGGAASAAAAPPAAGRDAHGALQPQANAPASKPPSPMPRARRAAKSSSSSPPQAPAISPMR